MGTNLTNYPNIIKKLGASSQEIESLKQNAARKDRPNDFVNNQTFNGLISFKRNNEIRGQIIPWNDELQVKVDVANKDIILWAVQNSSKVRYKGSGTGESREDQEILTKQTFKTPNTFSAKQTINGGLDFSVKGNISHVGDGLRIQAGQNQNIILNVENGNGLVRIKGTGIGPNDTATRQTVMTKGTLKEIVNASTDFADFKRRVNQW